MTQYWLAAHAHVAVLGPQTVFFDSRQRLFCALRSSWVHSLRATIEEWSLPEAQYEVGEEDACAPPGEFAAYLVKRGLLTTVRDQGKRMEQLRLAPAQHALMEQGDITQIRVGSVIAARILYSAAVTAWRFRYGTLNRRLQELAHGHPTHSDSRARLPAQRISQLVSAYWRVRPLLPFDRYTDFLDSFTMIEYLAHYFVFPRLVIGVRLMPFTTYTWVQDSSTVLNDYPEFVGQFTPIFAT